jgi:hypothetical protein
MVAKLETLQLFSNNRLNVQGVNALGTNSVRTALCVAVPGSILGLTSFSRRIKITLPEWAN